MSKAEKQLAVDGCCVRVVFGIRMALDRLIAFNGWSSVGRTLWPW